jgi:FAD:protein FMN transferase
MVQGAGFKVQRSGFWFGVRGFWVLGMTLLAVGGCGRSGSTPAVDGEEVAERVGLAMGSKLSLQALTSDPAQAESAFEAIFAEFERLDRLLSVWKPGSDVLKVNAAAGVSPAAVGPDLIDVLQTARQISEWTHGKFDVTFGALSDIWKFDQDQDDSVPTPEQIAVRRPLVDYKAIEVDRAAHTVFLRRKGMRMHLGGIGKGYAVEHAVQILRSRGFHNFLIQAGGDMYVAGTKHGRPWRLGIADPRNPAQSFGTLDLTDGTFSTSGDYERTFIKDGVRYHHIIDPETGMPARGCRSVTIVTNSPRLADGLSTGVFLLGAEEGMALVERLPDVEAVIVTDRNQVLVSGGLRDKFRQIAPPSDGL